VRIFAHHHLLREPQITRRVEELVDYLELRSHLDVPVRALSGGDGLTSAFRPGRGTAARNCVREVADAPRATHLRRGWPAAQ